MKKMQCEVCGSYCIKKVDSTTFECQSCGVQYSKEELQKLLVEITGSVKIDHSDEVENTIKRAEQFENEGDSNKAKEYYNRALDIDAENEVAYQRLKEISDNQILEEYYYVKPTIDPDGNVKKFLRELAASENVACDIYKEISLKKVYQKFYTFAYSKYNIKCDWSAVVCTRYYENETVYKTVYRNGKSYSEPKTELVEKIRRIPRNGVYKYDAEGLIFSSQELSQAISVSDEDKRNAILNDFINLQSNKYASYSVNHVNPHEVVKENGKFYYYGYELDLNVDHDLYTQNSKSIVDKKTEQIFPDLVKHIGGDFYENPHTSVTYRTSDEKYVCVPVQIIEYDYKGTSYFAISDLVSQTTTVSKLYPSDEGMVANKEEFAAEEQKIEKKSTDVLKSGFFTMLSAVVFYFLCAINDDSEFFIVLGIAATVIGILIMIGSLVFKNIKTNALDECKHEKIGSVYGPRKSALSVNYKEYFAVIENQGSYDEAKNAVTGIYSVASSLMRLSPAGEFKKFSADINNEMNEKERIITRKKDDIKKFRTYNLILIVACVISFSLIPFSIALMDLVHVVVGILAILLLMGAFIFSIVMLGVYSRKVKVFKQEIQEEREKMMY